jgi:hypothetical protein
MLLLDYTDPHVRPSLPYVLFLQRSACIGVHAAVIRTDLFYAV